ncbi:MAG TPA: exodeoxyribonuclease VII large subunit [Candidatus Krumholzibacteria bacterium]|nr:exodeoxyribonuclease VII large subunit [Candidatus Krumholzibacteria bacterium]
MVHGESTVFAVSELNALVRELLEDQFAEVAVEGETSNVRVHASGHVYFRLKDASASLSAVCFRSDARLLDFDLSDGQRVVARGRLTIYEVQGSYQLVARAIEPAGRGDLERAFRLLVSKLDQEGLFDEARKRPLPRYPRTIAVVTSPTGAAVRDIFSTLARRFPCVEVVFAPVQVQGERAPFEIVRALDALNDHDVDVVILGRGGGSIEDLWAFNDESVARAIHRSRAPVVSAVGHETDVTIADFVADRRAATPTMAAEIVVPEREDVARRLDAYAEKSRARMTARVGLEKRRVAELVRSYALGQVRGRVERGMQSLDFALERVQRALVSAALARRAALDTAGARLAALDPREVLRRGYAVCHDESGAHLVRGAHEAAAAGRMRVTFHDGVVAAAVEGMEIPSAKEAAS